MPLSERRIYPAATNAIACQPDESGVPHGRGIVVEWLCRVMTGH